MTYTWQLQEAKNKFSEVVDSALTKGPQIVTRRGVEVAVVLSYADYQALTAQQKRLSHFFRESPLAYETLDLTRDTSGTRDDIEL